MRTVGADALDTEGAEEVANRLQDILDMHIVVADNEDEPLSGFIDEGTLPYVLTKGGSVLALSGTGEQVKVQGGGDMELGLPEAEVVTCLLYTSGRAMRLSSHRLPVAMT